MYYQKDSQRKPDNKGNWPQKWFRDKSCKMCSTTFTPTSPCMFYCSEACEVRGYTDRYLQRNYGVSLSWYEKTHKKQNGLCAICNGEGFLMDPTKHRTKLVVDHCHKTGVVRGLLCHNCNRALGLFKDDPKAMTNAVSYVEGATTIPQGSTLK